MFTLLCLPMFIRLTNVYVFTYVYPFFVFTYVYSCLPMITSVYSC